jgi:hypothetical protein
MGGRLQLLWRPIRATTRASIRLRRARHRMIHLCKARSPRRGINKAVVIAAIAAKFSAHCRGRAAQQPRYRASRLMRCNASRISPRALRPSMPNASDAGKPDESPRAGRLGNKWTTTAYQKPAQSLSATRPAATDPTAPFSPPQRNLGEISDPSPYTPSFPLR